LLLKYRYAKTSKEVTTNWGKGNFNAAALGGSLTASILLSPNKRGGFVNSRLEGIFAPPRTFAGTPAKIQKGIQCRGVEGRKGRPGSMRSALKYRESSNAEVCASRGGGGLRVFYHADHGHNQEKKFIMPYSSQGVCGWLVWNASNS